VPIKFHVRRRGESKLSMRQRVEYLEHVARLYRYRQSATRWAATPPARVGRRTSGESGSAP
jgi:hypothetical protein